MSQSNIFYSLLALVAAILFGISAPLSKLLLGEIDPVILAALLYLGSGLGLLIYKALNHFVKSSKSIEAGLIRTDLPWLVGATLAGGVIAPIILLYGLDATPAATASLLLNFESVATTLLAAIVFKEAVSRHAWWAIILITLASVFLSIDIDSNWGLSIGALGIVAACFFWGIDNNLTRNISSKDPIITVMIKGIAAGTFSLILAFTLGQQLPALLTIIKALLLGSLSYGLSITLFVLALRGLGAARTSALFSTSPLSGLALSFALFRETPGNIFLIAFPLMILGTTFLVREEHAHTHAHNQLTHEHAHAHDENHHNHSHNSLSVKRHSHLHEHEHIEHEHQHMPDTHHRHSHN
jgi:drug/metabolite transporter (DMT)-like permease